MVEASPRPRAASERPPAPPAPGPGPGPRAASSGPPARDQGAYECNYETLDSPHYTNNNQQSNQAILKLEQAVRSIDQVLAKDISKLRPEVWGTPRSSRGSEVSAVQYDSITVLPARQPPVEPPPPPLPRTRSFRDASCRAPGRGPGPWAAGPRASSAPPVSPGPGRRTR
jgi:hypothetical protein